MCHFSALASLILLVQRDCDITVGDGNGYLALHHSAKNNKLDCCRFLVKQGTSIEATQADGKTPAHVVNIDIKHTYFTQSNNLEPCEREIVARVSI